MYAPYRSTTSYFATLLSFGTPSKGHGVDSDQDWGYDSQGHGHGHNDQPYAHTSILTSMAIAPTVVGRSDGIWGR